MDWTVSQTDSDVETPLLPPSHPLNTPQVKDFVLLYHPVIFIYEIWWVISLKEDCYLYSFFRVIAICFELKIHWFPSPLGLPEQIILEF